MATTARGIVYPTVGTTLTPLANHFASLATSTNTAIDNVVNGAAAFRGLDAAKGAAGQEGRTYYSTDTNRTWFDDGSNWISADNGMYLIRPTSVTGTGVSIGSNGEIVFTSVAPGTVVQILGIFSSRFRNYETRAVWTAKNANVDCPVRGLVGTTAVSAGTYSRAQQFLIAGARADSQATGMTDFGSVLTPYWGTLGASHTRWFSPNAAIQTYSISDWTVLGGSTGVGTLTSNLNSGDQLTGLQITMGAGSAYSGVISCYGIL
jgi:hypothetical protein